MDLRLLDQLHNKHNGRISYSGLVTQIRNYTEVDSTVFSADQLENIILNAQYRIMRDVPIDADRKQQSR